MSLAETELTIGGTSFKGVYIAILLSLATTLGGGVWTASSLYSRLEAVEALQIPELAPLEEQLLKAEQDLETKIELIEQELTANDVSQLQGKLATLGVNLETIATQQSKLLTINDKVVELEKELESMRVTVTQAELIAKDLQDVDSKIKKINTEIEDLWSGMDYLSNPLN
jgi:predicted RNase H-like nuclease (RuvC/YqgF family)